MTDQPPGGSPDASDPADPELEAPDGPAGETGVRDATGGSDETTGSDTATDSDTATGSDAATGSAGITTADRDAATGSDAAAGSAGITTADRGRTPFPPDELLDLPGGLSFVRLLLLVAFVAFLVDLIFVHILPFGPEPSGEIPYSYPFFVSVVYLVATIPVVRRVHDVLAAVRDDLVAISGRETMVDGPPADGPTPAEIDAEIGRALRRWFHPRVLVGGAAAAGVVGLGILVSLTLTVGGGSSPYPHLLTAFAYMAVHGMYAGPLLGGVVLIRRIANEYIVDVDVLAPDGIGGYRAIGDGLVTLLTYAIVVVTLDFVMLSSVLYLSSSRFRWVVVAIYGVWLAGMVVLTFVSVVAIRNRLLSVRDRKVDALREEFEAVEAAFWEKHRRGEDSTVEAQKIRTMRAMFAELNGMSLWPLNLYSVVKVVLSLVASVGTSVAVVYIEQVLAALGL